MTGRNLRVSIILLFFLITASLYAGEPVRLEPYVPQPGEADTLEVYLLIIGRGEPMYAWWGHIGIVIHDTETGAEYLYDYGNFSFEEEDFFTNFAMGRLWFQMMRMFSSNYMEYIGDQDRDLRMHRLNLPYHRERSLKRFLDWNKRPENRMYLYHHYYDNCSTRVRDLFNLLTDGALEEASSDPVGLSIRELSRKYSWFHPVGDWIITYLLAGSCDRQATWWEAMFLPDYLERFVLDFSYTDEQGNTVPFVLESQNLHLSRHLLPVPFDRDPPVWWRGLLLGLAWALPGLFLGAFRRTRGLRSVWRVLTGVLPALPGSILFFMMFFSNHDVTYGNWNILVASPLGFAVIPLVIWGSVVRRRNPDHGNPLPERLIGVLFGVMAVLSLVALAGGRFPGATQNNLLPVMTFLPGYLAGFLRWEALSGWFSARATGQPPRQQVSPHQ